MKAALPIKIEFLELLALTSLLLKPCHKKQKIFQIIYPQISQITQINAEYLCNLWINRTWVAGKACFR